MRALKGSIIAAALVIAPAAASADIVTVTMAGLSNNDGSTITTTDVFKYGSGIHIHGLNFDEEGFSPPFTGLISSTIQVSDTPGYYTGPVASYDLMTPSGGVDLTRNALSTAPGYGADFEMDAFDNPLTIAYDDFVYDAFLLNG